MNTDQQRVRDILRAYDTPLVFSPGGWGNDLPKYWQERVIAQRLEMLDKGVWDKATDAEVAMYLSSASLEAPLNSDWADIFVYETAQLLPGVYEALGREPIELSEYQKGEVNHLKHQIRESQLKNENKTKGGTMTNRKIVIEEQENGTLIGISRAGVDPFVKKMELTFDKVLETAPFLGGVLTVAEQQWAVNPKNPAYVAPPKAPGISTPKASVKPAETKKTKAKSAGKKVAVTKPAPTGETPPAPETKTPPVETVATVPETTAPVSGTPTPDAALEASLEAKTFPEPAGPRVCDTEHLRDYPGCHEECEHDVCTGGTRVDEPVQQASEAAREPASSEAPKTEPEKLEQPVAQKTTRISSDAFQYKLKDGRGPFATIQLALDAMGADKVNRPLHNRYDRLSKKLQAEIIQEKKP